MPDKISAPNYPDILGYITDDQAATFGVVQAALAVRPPVVRAGKPFGVIMLLQNTSDAPVNITTRINLPAKDNDGKPDRLICRQPRIELTLRPAEVGYLTFPVLTLADTTPAKGYKLAVDLQAEVQGKPRRIRHPDPQAEVNLDYYFFLTEETTLRLIALKMLNYSFNKTRGIVSAGLETSVGIAQPKPAPKYEVKPGWVSLWALDTSSDARPLLERYGDTLLTEFLPRLDYVQLYKALFPLNKQRILSVYPAQNTEIHYITKVMVALLHQAYHRPEQYDYPGQEMYTVSSLLRRGWPTDGSPIPLPHWCLGILPMIGIDPQILVKPELAFTGALYEPLLRDAIEHGFRLVSAATRRQLGTPDELRKYTQFLLKNLHHPQKQLTFDTLYVPLVLGGVVISEDIPLPKEAPLDILHKLMALYSERAKTERNPQTERAFQLADETTNWAVRRYSEWM